MNKQKQKIQQAIEKIREEFPDSEAVFKRVYETMSQKADNRCLCDVPILNWYVRATGKFKYRCLRCDRVISPLSVTPLNRQHKNLTDTIELACRVYYKRRVLTPTEISKLYNCQYRTAVRQTKRVIRWIYLAEQQSELPVKIPEDVAIKRICRSFTERNPTVNAAINSLFNALPSLRAAMKENSQNQ